VVSARLQALSAAYSPGGATRWPMLLALSSGVPQADLQPLRLQAPLLVPKLQHRKQLDWPAVPCARPRTGSLRSLLQGKQSRPGISASYRLDSSSS